MTVAHIVNLELSRLTVFAELISVVILAALCTKGTNPIIRFFKKYGMAIAFIVALTAMAGSLTYSDVLLYNPCKLCWFQRILMYPLVLILGVGFWKKDAFKTSTLYALIMSLIGIPVALYHYLEQIGVVSPTCAIGSAVSCAKKYTLTFGYITIPFMALSAFLLIALIMLVLRRGDEAVQADGIK